jgi:hypothetical protein
MFFQSVIFKVSLLLMCLLSVFGNCARWKLIVGHRDICYAKEILNYFGCVEVWILVEKWIIYEPHIFPRSLVQTCWMETTSLCLNTWLRVNKNFQILINFTEIQENVWLLCAHTLMTSIIFILEDLTLKKTSVT